MNTHLRRSGQLPWTLRLRATAICLALSLHAAPVAATERVDDGFLTGYIASVLERDLHWERDSYTLEVVNGKATITLSQEDPLRRQAVNQEVRPIDGVAGVTVRVKPGTAGTPEAVGSFMGVTAAAQAFPSGDLFQPLIADPKQARFFATLLGFRSMGENYPLASVGFGETFGFYRMFGQHEGDGLQLSVVGALFAQFNMDSSSSDLINADYTIGIPATYRYGDNSLRLRLYHQSSHLGDEFLLGVNPPERVNLSYESLELLYSREWRGFRAYAGGEYLVHKEPSDLKPLSAHWGVEYRGSTPLLWNGRPLIGVDIKNVEEHGWDYDCSVKAGLEFGHPDPGQRRLSLMAEWYRGFDPHGQFYMNEVEYYGLGVALGF